VTGGAKGEYQPPCGLLLNRELIAIAHLGVGRMISQGFVENGAKVYISSRDAKACEKACEELNKLGKGTAHAIPADFYKLEDCKKLAEELGNKEKSECDKL